MVDIFISYKGENRNEANAIAEMLTQNGYKVWWDINLLPGQDFANEINFVIKNAKAVVVLWTLESIKSHWVKAESTLALDKGILVPVWLQYIDLPAPFNTIQTLDLTSWDGSPTDLLLGKLLHRINQLTTKTEKLTVLNSVKSKELINKQVCADELLISNYVLPSDNQVCTQEGVNEAKAINDFYERQKSMFLNSSAMPWLLGNSVSRDFIIPSLVISSKVKLVKHHFNADFNYLLNNYSWKDNILIIGPPGAGKSTLLLCYYIELISKQDKYTLNIFLDARDLDTYPEDFNSEAILLEYLGDKHGVPQLVYTKWMRYVLLIDGLDEITETLFIKIIKLVNNSPNNFSFIMACRDQTYYLRSAHDNSIERAFSESILISPWSIESSKEYVKKYLYAIGLKEKYIKFEKSIINNPNFYAFCSNPFQLNILIYIYIDEAQSLSHTGLWNTYSLYDKYINLLWKNEKIKNPKNKNFNDFIELCTEIAISLYNMKDNILTEKYLCVIQDSTLLSVLTTDHIERILKFKHESMFEYFIAKSFINVIRNGTTEALLHEFRNFYNYYINGFIRDGMLVYRKEADKFYKKLSTIYLACFNKKKCLQDKMMKNINEYNRLVVGSFKKVSNSLSENLIERELSIYYIGRLELNSFPEILKLAYFYDPSYIIKRTAAIGAMLYHEESIEFDYIDTLSPNSSDDITHRSLTLLYFEDAFGDIVDYKDDGKVSWEKSKQAIILRLSQDTNRNLSFRLWDLRTISLFCQNRNSCEQLTEFDIDIISNTNTACSFFSKEKESRIMIEKDNLIRNIKTTRHKNETNGCT